jgi:hypothetical protein
MPKNRLNTSLEQVCDGMIKLIVDNAGARTALIVDAPAGSTTLTVDSTAHFQDAQQIALMDVNDGHIEWHSILSLDNIHTVRLVQPTESNFTVAEQATMQLAIGNVPLPTNAVLFGDREVIPNPDISITVDPTTMNTVEWMYLKGGLSMQHNLVITVYVKLDTHDNAIRVVQKYGDYLFGLIINNLHLDVVNDEVFITQDAMAGSRNVYVSTLNGWAVDTVISSRRYEIQDNNSAENDFWICQLVDDPFDALGQYHIVLDRPLGNTYRVNDRAIFRRRVRYLWNALVSEVEYGFINKSSQMYKACKLNWWGKEVSEVQFPQITTGGIM